MKILVTGGAGFIGSHIVDQYVSQGHDVVIVDNLSTGDKNQINPKAKFYVCDISSKDLQSVFEMERPEIVNHHAAQISVPYSVLHPVEDAQTNVIGMLNLLENCRRYQTRKIIFASSGGAVYGEAETVPTPETEIPRPQSPYAIHKLMGERYIDYYHSVYGLDYTVL
ncbi:MAG TPA: NAD-dependent epimerase/dehydratase family protein, partial [Candidatus Cloacimonadota bacterium]|nr:NAD-dependent epimerase/dehydratase family protein [Candidatus Cloacimonadota bacterium]